MKKKKKNFCKEFCKKLYKKIILGTSDTWSPSHLSQTTREPAYYIVDFWTFNPFFATTE